MRWMMALLCCCMAWGQLPKPGSGGSASGGGGSSSGGVAFLSGTLQGNGPANEVSAFPRQSLLALTAAYAGAACTVAPTGSGMVFDILDNGTSIFGSNPKPTINVNTYSSSLVSTFTTTAIAATDVITAKVITQDSNLVGAQCTVSLAAGGVSGVPGAAGATGSQGVPGTTGSPGTNGTNGAISQIYNNGTSKPVEPYINLISGTNATVTCADNSAATRTDCTVSATGGASGWGIQMNTGLGAIGSNSTTYFPLAGTLGNGATGIAASSYTNQSAHSYRNMCQSVDFTLAGSLVMTLYVNGSPSALTVTAPNGGSGLFCDNTHTVSTNAGDTLVYQITNNGGGTQYELLLSVEVQ